MGRGQITNYDQEAEIVFVRGRTIELEFDTDNLPDVIKLRPGVRVVLLTADDLAAIENGYCPNCDE